MKKLFIMLSLVAMVFAAGCHKEPQNGGENGGGNGNGGNNGGGDNPTPTVTTYTVTFNANGGTGEMTAQVFTEGEAQVLKANAFTYAGYTFAGWNTTATGTGTAYTDGQTITAASDMTLYAQWKLTYTVTFNANGGTGTMQPQAFTEGKAKALMANVFTYQYHTFVNWNTVADGSGTSYTDAQEITVAANMTLYAQWSNMVNGHEWVDLGLPSGKLWATCNVGANTPTDYGDYFAWGETQPQASNAYNWSSYKYANGDYDKLTKYCTRTRYGDNGFTDHLTTLEASDDAATANWGAGWRMPTETELRELNGNCTVTWTTQNGINGRLFTGPNGNSIFLPAGGLSVGGLHDVGSYGNYWSSSLDTGYPYGAMYLCFYSGGCKVDFSSRYYGFTVRPVCSVSQK